MSSIESIGPEHQPILDAKAQEWMKIGLATGAGDVTKIKEGIAKSYVAAGFAPPKYFVHLKSPCAGALAVCLVKDMSQTLFELLNPAEPRRDLTKRIAAALSDPSKQLQNVVIQTTFMANILEETWSQLVPQIHATENMDLMPNLAIVWPFIRASLYEQIESRSLVWDTMPVYGAHDAAWLAFYDTMNELGMKEVVAPMVGLMDVAKECGWWWPMDDVAIFTDRPLTLHQNERGELHNESGAAISYGDGWSLWAINRVILTEQIVEKPHTLTVDQIVKEENSTIKAIMLQRHGFDNFIRNSEAKKLDASDYGTLWVADLGNNGGVDSKLVMVEVVCPSTDTTYMLRVPPHLTRARDAVAWTFREDDPNNYTPVIQA